MPGQFGLVSCRSCRGCGSGLPGVGKTTIARRQATSLPAAYLRIDAIEHALRQAGIDDVGVAGYAVGYALAKANLALGHVVVADSVNPLDVTRAAWRAAAGDSPILEVELICTDAAEHRRRVEEREADLAG